jgi:hypothetical protein
VEAVIALCLGVVGQLDVCVVHVALVSVATTASDAFTLDEAPFSKDTGQLLARDGVVRGNEFDVGFPIVVEYTPSPWWPTPWISRPSSVVTVFRGEVGAQMALVARRADMERNLRLNMVVGIGR